jgi:uncharacterized protein (DUF1697 family)
MPPRVHYVALLRGINVGGNNLIRMPALKACFEAAGLSDVSTYIASGNVLFTATPNKRALTTKTEAILAKTFNYPARVVLRSFEEMRAVVQNAPKGFGTKPREYRYDVFFLREPLTADEALTSMSAKPGVDRIAAGDGVLYTSRLISRATSSRLGRIVGTPVYRDMTIRNWNTTRKLHELLERMATS